MASTLVMDLHCSFSGCTTCVTMVSLMFTVLISLVSPPYPCNATRNSHVKATSMQRSLEHHPTSFIPCFSSLLQVQIMCVFNGSCMCCPFCLPPHWIIFYQIDPCQLILCRHLLLLYHSKTRSLATTPKQWKLFCLKKAQNEHEEKKELKRSTKWLPLCSTLAHF